MKHLAIRAAFGVLALAISASASAQTVTSTLTQTATTATATVSTGAETDLPQKRVRRKITAYNPREYRNPQGSVLAGFFFGVGYDSIDGAVVAFGLGFGYALLTGVVPGVRAEVIYQNGFGGQLAANLTLTPPFSWSVTPFVLGEVGAAFEPDRSGTLYGGGFGAYLGDPAGRAAVQIGYIWRRLNFGNGEHKDGSTPVIGLVYRF